MSASHREHISLKTFSLDTVKKSCYRFASRYCVGVDQGESDDTVVVTFRFPEDIPENDRQAIVDRFQQDLIDQDLRAQVGKETEVVRTLILANAFANSALVDDDA